MPPFQRLPTLDTNRNALIDFSPLNQAFAGVRQQAESDRQYGLQQDQMKMQRERFGMEKQRFAADESRRKLDQIAAIAEAADRETDPTRRAAIYRRAVSQHPDYAAGKLDPIYMDPVNGPKLLMAEAGKFRDALAEKERLSGINLKNAQAAAARADQYTVGDGVILNRRTGDVKPLPEGAGSKTSLQPVYGVDRDGNPVVMQPRSDGSLAASKMPDGVTISKAPIKIDGGTEWILLDPITRAPLSRIPKGVSEAAAAKEVGEAAGKARVDLPRVDANADLALKTIEQIRNHPGKPYALGLAGRLPIIPNTAQAGFVNLVEQAKGQAFLEAFNSLRGGGQITEAEGAKATQALARLDRAQRPEDFDQALRDLEDILKSSKARAKAAAGAVPQGGGDPPRQQTGEAPRGAAMPSGSYVFDPATGQLVPKRTSDAARRRSTLDGIDR